MIPEIANHASGFWMEERDKRLLSLFSAMAERVPAYKDFLKKESIDPRKIKTIRDFAAVPPIGKKNYLRAYPFEQLLWDGTVRRPEVFTSTSGSTGGPFYFPRDGVVDRQSAAFHKLFFDQAARARHASESTLFIVGFGMGIWIGGLITYQAIEMISTECGYPISIATPGANKEEIFHILRELAPKFENVVLSGYPPFVKDIVDEAADLGIDWAALNVRIVFAAEAFSEEFRDHVTVHAAIENPYRDTMNIYGSADLGTMAVETPIAILARRLALQDRKLWGSLFPEKETLPTFAQFHPEFTNFEAVDGEILCSGSSALPLVRYAIGDRGAVLSFDEVARVHEAAAIDLRKTAALSGLADTIRELPFVAVYERSDLSTKLYGAIIHPEHIKRALYGPAIAARLTGKFTAITKNDEHHNEYLEVNVELRKGVAGDPALQREAGEAIMKSLIQYNGEYRYLATHMPERIAPKIILRENAHPDYFISAGKQQWVKKTWI